MARFHKKPSSTNSRSNKDNINKKVTLKRRTKNKEGKYRKTNTKEIKNREEKTSLVKINITIKQNKEK